MNRTTPQNNELTATKLLLIVQSGYEERAEAIQHLTEHFFGEVIVDPTEPLELGSRRVYACGDLHGFTLDGAELHAIDGLSRGHLAHDGRVRVVRQGQVPISVHGLGVLFRELFEPDDFFGKISTEHTFQNLTESNKPSLALRTGIYLSEVTPEEREGDADALHFHLMRCSSNLTGPTDNFRETDRRVLHEVNDAARHLFTREVPLNHVLAQIYENRRLPNSKEKKAKIGAHSDKTKDMHPDGVMAFCSFYRASELAQLERSKTDPYDYVSGRASGLTKLVFKLKNSVEDPSLVDTFTVTLYPNSVFFIPLSTNRLYTHAIRPSTVSVEKLPTRMGYVVRCSAQEAVFMNGQTYIREGAELTKLEPMDIKGARELRTSYFQENSTDEDIQYGHVQFSMNAGDYMKPIH